MADARLGDFLRTIRGSADAQPFAGDIESELRRRYIAERDGQAFQVLSQRHGPLVWGVCRRLLRHHQDAEDAFQATFLVFARKAASIRKAGSLASWLHGVAYR